MGRGAWWATVHRDCEELCPNHWSCSVPYPGDAQDSINQVLWAEYEAVNL